MERQQTNVDDHSMTRTRNRRQEQTTAEATADATALLLAQHGLLRDSEGRGSRRFLVTDNPQRFERVGSYFLDAPHAAEVVDIDDDDHATWHAIAGAQA